MSGHRPIRITSAADPSMNGDYYRGRKLLAEVAGEGPVDGVAEAIRRALGQGVGR